ncbi:HupE/UreJ family protein [Thiolapillus sp.]
MRKQRFLYLSCFLGVLLTPGIALAHIGTGQTGIVAGLLHPLTGWDHVLFAFAAGLWLSSNRFKLRQGLALFLAPLMAGMLMGANGSHAGFMELLLGVSVAITVIMLLPRATPGRPWGIVLLSTFALMHGLAHGHEMISLSLQGSLTAAAIALSSGCVFLAGHFMGSLTKRDPRQAAQ